MANFQEIAIIARKLNKMPVNYRNFAGREFETFYTTVELLQDIVFKAGEDNSREKEYRSLETSCLKEMGFKYIALFVDKVTGESIAILGI